MECYLAVSHTKFAHLIIFRDCFYQKYFQDYECSWKTIIKFLQNFATLAPEPDSGLSFFGVINSSSHLHLVAAIVVELKNAGNHQDYFKMIRCLMLPPVNRNLIQLHTKNTKNGIPGDDLVI